MYVHLIELGFVKDSYSGVGVAMVQEGLSLLASGSVPRFAVIQES